MHHPLGTAPFGGFAGAPFGPTPTPAPDLGTAGTLRGRIFFVTLAGEPIELSTDPLTVALECGRNGALAVAALLSLATDARCADDVVPPSGTARRGWWADAVAGPNLWGAAPHGSLLWLHDRDTLTPANIAAAADDAAAALQWMVDAGLAGSVSAFGERSGDRCAIALTVTPPASPSADVAALWEGIALCQ